MKKICIYSALFLISLFSLSCSMQDHVLPVPDVYVSGYERTDNAFSAKYWKNGQPVNLTTSDRFIGATSIAVSGSDVYVVGYEVQADGSSLGRYWKNGVLENFSKDISSSILSDVEVSGGDVYVAGLGFNGPDYYAAYWKNGVSVKLPGNGGWARSITISGSDVYVAGFTFNGTHQVATVWKNGVPTELNDGTSDAVANGIAVSGNEVYVVGSAYLNGLTVSRYWKNGVELGITSNKVYSELADVTVSNNGVYMVGREVDGLSHILYWHNSLQIVNGYSGSGSGVKVQNNDVYISGDTSNGVKGIANYWKNGEQVILSDGTTDNATTSIFVTNP